MDFFLKILREPAFNTLLTILGIILAYFIYKWSKKKKEITYDIVVKTNLLPNAIDIREKLEITYKNKKISQASIVAIKIENSGNQAIRPEDYKEPLTFDFNESSTVLSAEVYQTDPHNMILKEIEFYNNTVVIPNVLLNSGDSISIKVIIENYSETLMNVKGRVVDMKNFKKRISKRGNLNRVETLLKTSFLLLAVIYWTLVIITPGLPLTKYLLTLLIVAVIASYITLTFIDIPK